MAKKALEKMDRDELLDELHELDDQKQAIRERMKEINDLLSMRAVEAQFSPEQLRVAAQIIKAKGIESAEEFGELGGS